MRIFFRECQKCGKIFEKIEISSPIQESIIIGQIVRPSDKKVCPNCGGSVIWVDEKGSPLNDYNYRWIEEDNRHRGVDYIWKIIALIGFLVFSYFVLK